VEDGSERTVTNHENRVSKIKEYFDFRNPRSQEIHKFCKFLPVLSSIGSVVTPVGLSLLVFHIESVGSVAVSTYSEYSREGAC